MSKRVRLRDYLCIDFQKVRTVFGVHKALMVLYLFVPGVFDLQSRRICEESESLLERIGLDLVLFESGRMGPALTWTVLVSLS